MGHLPHSDLGKSSLVCHDLHRIGNEDMIWRKKGFLRKNVESGAGADSTPSPRLVIIIILRLN